MYGPPPDERQILAPIEAVDDPTSYAACLAVGAALSLAAIAWRRPPQALRYGVFILGQVVALTAPLAFYLDTYVYGSFPTIDKQGSLLFYLDGVHERMLLHPLASPADPAARLIGVHVGHLWVTALFDLFLSPIGAFNAQALLYPALGWWAAWLLLRAACGDARIALVLAYPFGMGLHTFRDLNWYTIEKAAVFWLPLFALALYRAWRDGGRWRYAPAPVFLLMSWMNLYLGLVGAALGACAAAATGIACLRAKQVLPQFRAVMRACALSALMVSPLLLWQGALMRNGPSLGTPERFLWERAALDGFSLAPLAWNRLEAHRALNMVAVGLAMLGAVRQRRDPRVRFAVGAGLLLAALAVGPVLLPGPVMNPLYMAVRFVVPGFWRVAKPEVFFQGTYLLMLAVAAIELQAVSPHRRGLGALYALFLLAWLAMVRTHPAYPPMTLPAEVELAPGWEERVFTP